MKMNSYMVGVILSSILVSGCSFLPPGCDSEETKETIKEIVLDSLQKTFESLGAGKAAEPIVAVARQDLSVELSSVRREGFDLGARKYSCKAVVSFTVPEGNQKYAKSLEALKNITPTQLAYMYILNPGLSVPIATGLSQVGIDSSGVHANIAYTSQAASGGEYYVEVFGSDPIVYALMVMTKMGAFNADANAASEKPSAPGSSAVASEGQPVEEIPTRFGTLKIDGENILTFGNKPLNPTIHGNSGLSVVGTYQIGSSDVVLLQDTGGSACPAQFHFVTVGPSGAKGSPAFGTCSDLIEVSQGVDSITVKMPGFQGPFESEEAQENAANEKHAFIYSDGKVVEAAK